MACSNNYVIEKKENDDSNSKEFSFLPDIQNGSFLNNNYINNNAPSIASASGDKPPSKLFPSLTDAIEDDVTDIFYIIDQSNGVLKRSDSSHLQLEDIDTFEENTEVIPAKKSKREMSLYEETLLKEFSSEVDREQKLLIEEHDMKMKLWNLKMQTSQQEHALKMAILKEKLEKVKQEKESLQRERNEKYLGRFSSGPI